MLWVGQAGGCWVLGVDEEVIFEVSGWSVSTACPGLSLAALGCRHWAALSCRVLVSVPRTCVTRGRLWGSALCWVPMIVRVVVIVVVLVAAGDRGCGLGWPWSSPFGGDDGWDWWEGR